MNGGLIFVKKIVDKLQWMDKAKNAQNNLDNISMYYLQINSSLTNCDGPFGSLG